jgi:AbrB family looped-hinge helix DNA binding protein
MTTIDKAGRVVIPKAIRDAAGLDEGREITVALRDGRVEIEAAATEVTLERRDGVLVAVSAGGVDPGPPLTADDVRVVVERLRQ